MKLIAGFVAGYPLVGSASYDTPAHKQAMKYSIILFLRADQASLQASKLK